MKQLTLAACIICAFVACNTATTSTENKTDTMAANVPPEENAVSKESATYAYPVTYSSDFTVSDSKYSQIVLQLWKDFDNNTLDNHKDAFADSVSMDFYDGNTMSGPRDSIVAGAKAARSHLKNVVSSVEVVTALKPKGKDETWVCIWGKEVDTHNNNKVDSINLHEVWMFNKDGKIAYMGQYKATPPSQRNK